MKEIGYAEKLSEYQMKKRLGGGGICNRDIYMVHNKTLIKS